MSIKKKKELYFCSNSKLRITIITTKYYYNLILQNKTIEVITHLCGLQLQLLEAC